MSPTTKQFKWQNRDTAAQDMLQLVYHAPPSISSLAARLLAAFRSFAVLPELREIFLDETNEAWQRTHALRAFAETPANLLVPELEPLVRAAIIRCEIRFFSPSTCQDALLIYQDDLAPDWLDCARLLAEKHPINRGWFFDILDSSNPLVQSKFLNEALHYMQSEEFEQLLLQRLLKLLEAHEELLDLTVVSTLLNNHSRKSQAWLNKRIDTVVALCLADPQSDTVKWIRTDWARLHQALNKQGAAMRLSRRRRWIDKQPDYQTSPAYQYLLKQYEAAKQGNKAAFYQLRKIAERWNRNIPMGAAATNLIGKLGEKYDAFHTLARLMRKGDIDDWDEQFFDSPIRYEAGEALLKFASPAAWEVLVDSYFIRPSDDLLSFQDDWIAHLTDVLSGETKEYTGMHRGNHRPWFNALINISDEQLEAILLKVR